MMKKAIFHIPKLLLGMIAQALRDFTKLIVFVPSAR